MRSQAVVEYGKPLQEIAADTPVPQGTEVLIKVGYCGVCHSDVHVQDGYFNLGGGNKLDVSRARKLPFTLGHEIEGEILAAGPEAGKVTIGAHCVVYPWIGCQQCAPCLRGEEHLCNKPKHLGINVAGGYATHIMVAHPRYLLDYSGVPADLAGTYMCSGLTAYSALKKVSTLGPKERLLIVGLGGVGMMGLQFARALFSNAPLGADVDEAKLAAAKNAGAHEVYNPKDSAAAKKLFADSNGGVGAVIDFVGSEASLAFATGAVRKGGQVIVVGLFGGAFSMPIPMFPIRAISVGGSFVGSLVEAHEVMAYVRTGKIEPIPLQERGLDEANRSLDDLREGRIIGRVVLKP